MGIQTQSALIAAILLLALGLNVALSERRMEHRKSYTALVFALFAYHLATFLHQLFRPDDPGASETFWLRILMLTGVGVAQASLRFFEQYLAASLVTARTVINIGSMAAVVLTVTRLGTSTFLAVCVAALALGSYAYGIWRLYQRYRRTDGVEERRLSYLVAGGAVSVGLSGLDLLSASGLPFPAFGHLFLTVYMYFWMQVVQRSRLLDLRELLGRGLALLIQSVATSAVFIGLLVWVADQPGLLLFNLMLASVVLFFTFEPVKRLIGVWIGRVLFRDTYELELQLTHLRRELAQVINLGDLADRLLGRLQTSRRVTHASVFLLEEGGTAYYSPRSIGPLEQSRLSVVQGRAFLDALERESVLGLDQVEQKLRDLEADPQANADRERLQAIRDTMNSISAALTFAVASKDRLLGFLNVKDARTREAFSSNEITLIASVTAQVTTVIENSELVQRLKERDRLQVLGEMAAGMAHEIRNPLGAIKAAGQLLEPETLDEEQREFVEVIIEESDRLNLVLSQFLDYARPFRGNLGPVDLTPVLERVATLIRADAPGVEIRVELPPELPVVAGDANQLLQVCLNLARNAAEAMEGEGELVLRAVPVSGGDQPRVEVQVADTGPGMTADVREHLFVPFFTTKGSGTGLGLAICQRILQHHGAEIRVQSEVGRGTTMAFRLAVADAADLLSGEHRRRLTQEPA